MNSDALILSLAYPETVVKVAEEWYSPYLHYFGLGKPNYIRAGHAALVLIKVDSDALEYFDFGRYIAPKGYGRLRSAITDHELELDIAPEFKDSKLQNLNEILSYLATHPELTHGNGPLVASVCHSISYQLAKNYLNALQAKGFIRYAAFMNEATNCARLVMDVVMNSTFDHSLKRKLKKINRFTPSTLGTVAAAASEKQVYKINERGDIELLNGSLKKQNAKLLLDRLKNHEAALEGNIKPLQISGLSKQAQWIGGVGAGAWFEIFEETDSELFRFKRTSKYGLDTDSLYKVDDLEFDIKKKYEFLHKSNCDQLYVRQGNKIFNFKFIRKRENLLIKSKGCA